MQNVPQVWSYIRLRDQNGGREEPIPEDASRKIYYIWNKNRVQRLISIGIFSTLCKFKLSNSPGKQHSIFVIRGQF